jgi:hypothetical protein
VDRIVAPALDALRPAWVELAALAAARAAPRAELQVLLVGGTARLPPVARFARSMMAELASTAPAPAAGDATAGRRSPSTAARAPPPPEDLIAVGACVGAASAGGEVFAVDVECPGVA